MHRDMPAIILPFYRTDKFCGNMKIVTFKQPSSPLDVLFVPCDTHRVCYICLLTFIPGASIIMMASVHV